LSARTFVGELIDAPAIPIVKIKLEAAVELAAQAKV
jgi:hypothetical protein